MSDVVVFCAEKQYAPLFWVCLIRVELRRFREQLVRRCPLALFS